MQSWKREKSTLAEWSFMDNVDVTVTVHCRTGLLAVLRVALSPNLPQCTCGIPF